MSDPIDWEALGVRLGAIRADGESGGSNLAREALCAILGSEELRRAVDYYISGEPGSELARSVLWMLRPWEAMDRCHEIWASQRSMPQRRRAIELLRVVADSAVLPWIPGLLDDNDDTIRDLGIQIVDQLVFAGLVEPAEVEPLLAAAQGHPDPVIRERAASIAEQLAASR